MGFFRVTSSLRKFRDSVGKCYKVGKNHFQNIIYGLDLILNHSYISTLDIVSSNLKAA